MRRLGDPASQCHGAAVTNAWDRFSFLWKPAPALASKTGFEPLSQPWQVQALLNDRVGALAEHGWSGFSGLVVPKRPHPTHAPSWLEH